MHPENVKDVEENKKEMMAKINTYLDNCIMQDERHIKKANLISYWLKDYIEYLRCEETFECSKLKEYKRGDIIKANLGFNVGSEEGGLHYCVVLDKKNGKDYSTLTVVPLSTQKSILKVPRAIVNLGDDIYESLEKKSKKMLKEIEENIYCAKNEKNNIDNQFSISNEDERKIQENKKIEIKKRLDNLQAKYKQVEKVDKSIDRMKRGTIALVNQITTISKQRIYDPKNEWDILTGIHLSKEKMDLIDEKIKKLYIN